MSADSGKCKNVDLIQSLKKQCNELERAIYMKTKGLEADRRNLKGDKYTLNAAVKKQVTEVNTSESSLARNYTVEDVISVGRFGVVYKATQKRDDSRKKYAVKVMLDGVGTNTHQLNEIVVGAFLQGNPHNNIVRFYGFYKDEIYDCRIFEFVTNGTLLELMEYRGKLSHAVITRLLKNLADGLCHLFQLRIAHRDLNLTNLLIKGQLLQEEESEEHLPTFQLMISGFGLATRSARSFTRCGSDIFMAPEVYYVKQVSFLFFAFVNCFDINSLLIFFSLLATRLL